MNKGDPLRLRYICIFLLSFFILLAFRIAYLQIIKRSFFNDLAQSQHYQVVPLSGKRGRILDRKSRVLSMGISSFSVFAQPHRIKNPNLVASKLARYLDLPEKKILDRLSKKKKFVWLKRKISWDRKELIKNLHLPGIDFISEEKRFYPQGEIAASVLGMVNVDNQGLEGIENVYDAYLRGKSGGIKVLKDSASEKIYFASGIIAPPEGVEVILTIDSRVQYWVEYYLEETIRNFNASRGSVIVMDANSGEILALANYPTCNLNHFNKSDISAIRNSAIADVFEPGSVFKVITLLSAIEENAYSDSDIIFCENGSYKIPGSVLHDYHAAGNLTFREVFMKSSNIGVGKIANKLGREAIYKSVKRLKFGELTKIDLPGEVAGTFKPLSQWSKTTEYMIPMGQEVGVTLIQLVRLFAVIANDGYLVKPFIVKSISSTAFSQDNNVQRESAFKPAVTQRARNILFSVVQDGTGKLAAIEDVPIGGKTGTAQKYDPSIGRYSPDKYRASFVGFIWDDKKPLVIGVSIDEPRKTHLGGAVSAPLFKKIAQQLVTYIKQEKDERTLELEIVDQEKKVKDVKRG